MSDLIKYGPEMAQIMQIVKNVNMYNFKYVHISMKLNLKAMKNTGNGFGNYWHHFTH